MLTLADGLALETLCESYARWRRASAQVAEHGEIVKSPNGYPIQNPWLAVANKSQEQFTALLREFGLTPSSRSRVQAIADDEGDADEGFFEVRRTG